MIERCWRLCSESSRPLPSKRIVTEGRPTPILIICPSPHFCRYHILMQKSLSRQTDQEQLVRILSPSPHLRTHVPR